MSDASASDFMRTSMSPLPVLAFTGPCPVVTVMRPLPVVTWTGPLAL